MDITPGESVRIIREIQGLSQIPLSALFDIPQTTISTIETGRDNLGVTRAKALGTVLRFHPVILVFPGWQLEYAAQRLSQLDSIPQPHTLGGKPDGGDRLSAGISWPELGTAAS